MKKKKQFIIATILASFLSTTIATPTFASAYRDVPDTHWAHSSIANISSMGLMVGNMSGNFEPDGFIDKFNTVNLLARMVGYRFTNATTQEQAAQDEAYNTYSSLIAQFSDRFTRWNSARNREIAFLLSRGILTPEDLNHFVQLSAAGVEQLRALSREEFAVFLVRAMDKQEEAWNFTEPDVMFADHDRIDVQRVPYVYYLKSLGIVDTIDDANNFAPRSAATRAAVAHIVDRAVNHPAGAAINTGVRADDIEEELLEINHTSQNVDVQFIQGSISNIFAPVNAVQVRSITEDHNNRIIRLSPDAQITVDGQRATINSLVSDMPFIAMLSGGEISQLAVMTVSAVEAPPTATIPNNPSVSTNPQVQLPAFFSTVEGRISAVTADTITLDVSVLNLRGEIITESRTYRISNNVNITRSNESMSLSSVDVGDLAVIQFSDNVVYTMNIYERDRNFTGTLLGRRINNLTGDVILTIEDSQNNEYQLRISDNRTQITRRGHTNVSWRDLRIGDTVNVVSEHDVILSISATGTASVLEGTITVIRIEEGNSYITLRNLSTGVISTHQVIPGRVDLYTLRIGSQVRLNLDSREVSGLTVLRHATPGGRTGNVTRVSRTSITLQDTSNSTSEILFNSNTVFMSAATGQRISINDVREGDLLYIVMDGVTSSMAATVTVLTR